MVQVGGKCVSHSPKETEEMQSPELEEERKEEEEEGKRARGGREKGGGRQSGLISPVTVPSPEDGRVCFKVTYRVAHTLVLR